MRRELARATAGNGTASMSRTHKLAIVCGVRGAARHTAGDLEPTMMRGLPSV